MPSNLGFYDSPHSQDCDCESGEYRYPLYDGHGIFLCYACPSCENNKMARFRPDIMDSYECDEPIEPE